MFFTWDQHVAWLVIGGAALLAMTILPRLLHTRPLSLPMIYVAIGYGVFELSDPVRGPRPLTSSIDAAAVEYVTEFVVIVSLVAAGLRLERRPGLASWRGAWHLLAITMPLTILAAFALGWWALGLAAAPAILLGGAIAPTDPVLADEVQVGPPGDGERDEVRFTLTAEAGLNDGLAFPFVHLALAATTATVASSFGQWVAYDVGYRIGVGLASGLALGWLINRFGRRTGEFLRTRTSEGLFLLGATLLVYGVTEVLNGYGFLAVFVAALARGADSDDDYRRDAHDFADQIESIVLAFVLLAFGALLSEGILDALTWRGAGVAAAIVVVIRPIAGWIGLIGRGLPTGERWAIAFFGIRGVGSLYYLSYALNQGGFEESAAAELWAVVALTMLISIGVHGVTASPVMHRIISRDLDRSEAEPGAPTSTSTNEGTPAT